MSQTGEYDSTWFLDSIKAVASEIEANLRFLQLKKERVASSQESYDLLTKSFKVIRDRVLALKDTFPENQVAVSIVLKELLGAIVDDRNKWEGCIFSYMDGAVRSNLFDKTDDLIKKSEMICSSRNANLPTQEECIDHKVEMIAEEPFKKILRLEECVKSIHEKTQSLRNDLDALRQDLVAGKKAIKECINHQVRIREEVIELTKRKQSDAVGEQEFAAAITAYKKEFEGYWKIEKEKEALLSGKIQYLSALEEFWGRIEPIVIGNGWESISYTQHTLDFCERMIEVLERTVCLIGEIRSNETQSSAKIIKDELEYLRADVCSKMHEETALNCGPWRDLLGVHHSGVEPPKVEEKKNELSFDFDILFEELKKSEKK